MNSSTMIKFLKKHYVDGVFHSHVSMINPRGKFQFNRESTEQFWELYCNIVSNNNCEILGIAEKVQNQMQVVADIDIKLIVTDEFLTHPNASVICKKYVPPHKPVITEFETTGPNQL